MHKAYFSTSGGVRSVSVLQNDDLDRCLAIDVFLTSAVESAVGALSNQIQQLVTFDGTPGGRGHVTLLF